MFTGHVWSNLWPSREWYVRAVRQNSIPARNGGYRILVPLQETVDWTEPFDWNADCWGGLWVN